MNDNVTFEKNRALPSIYISSSPFHYALAATRSLDPVRIIIRYYALTSDLWSALMIRYVIFLFTML